MGNMKSTAAAGRPGPAKWLIFAPAAGLVAAGVAYHNPAHTIVKLACILAAMLYLGGLFLVKAALIIAWFQPDEGHSETATRLLGAGLVAVAVWQFYHAVMHLR